jgi:hypothetical protein
VDNYLDEMQDHGIRKREDEKTRQSEKYSANFLTAGAAMLPVYLIVLTVVFWPWTPAFNPTDRCAG